MLISFHAEKLAFAAQLSDDLLSLPEVAALMRGVDEEAGPDAVANSRIHRRGDLYLVNGAPAASAQSRYDSLLPLEKSGEHGCNLAALGRLQRNHCFRADSSWRLKKPGQEASPKIGVVGCIRPGFAGAGIGDDLLPDGEVGIRTQIEVLKALGNRPGPRGWGPGAQLVAAGADERLRTRADGGELGL